MCVCVCVHVCVCVCVCPRVCVGTLSSNDALLPAFTNLVISGTFPASAALNKSTGEETDAAAEGGAGDDVGCTHTRMHKQTQ